MQCPSMDLMAERAISPPSRLFSEGVSCTSTVTHRGGGAITVCIRSAQSGEMLLGPSSPIVHSSARAEVSWGAHSLEQLAGMAVVLTISIEEAELYSFQFVE